MNAQKKIINSNPSTLDQREEYDPDHILLWKILTNIGRGMGKKSELEEELEEITEILSVHLYPNSQPSLAITPFLPRQKVQNTRKTEKQMKDKGRNSGSLLKIPKTAKQSYPCRQTAHEHQIKTFLEKIKQRRQALREKTNNLEKAATSSINISLPVIHEDPLLSNQDHPDIDIV